MQGTKYNGGMPDAPKQDWRWYEERTRAADADWARNLTTADRWAMLCEMFEFVRRHRDPTVDWAHLEEVRWQQKLAARRKAVEIYRKLDEWRERNPQRDAG